MRLQFFVAGHPKAQGSMRSFKHSKTGRIVTPQNPKVKDWRRTIGYRAAELMHGTPLFEGPLRVETVFWLLRPKNHYRTGSNSHLLKGTAPDYPHGNVGDGDKLTRAVWDALTGVVWADDCQVVEWVGKKKYNQSPGVMVTVETMEEIEIL